MMTDPGTRWGYGPSTDCLGLVVEKVSGQRIDAFLKKNLLEARGADGKFGDFAIATPSNPEVYGMGHAQYLTPQDYLRFLRMFRN